MKLFSKKRGATLVVAIITLIISIFVLTTVLQATSGIFRIKHDNSNKLQDFITDLNELDALNKAGDVKENFFISNPEEMFMFFSTGTGNIELTGGPEGSYTFLRPKDPNCNGKSCVCYCKSGTPWAPSNNEPYLRESNLFMNKDYKCSQAQCMPTDNPHLLFANSRGYDQSYTDDVQKIVKRRTDNEEEAFSSETFSPIPFDIPILVRARDSIPGRSPGQDPFFDWDPGVLSNAYDYNMLEQETFYVDLVLSYHWEGGVVIGGTGYATKHSEGYQDLKGPGMNLVFEKSDLEGAIGVCLDFDNCLRDEAKRALQEDSEILKAESEVVTAADFLSNFVTQETIRCLDQEQSKAKCLSEFKLQALVSFLHSGNDDLLVRPLVSFASALNELDEESFTMFVYLDSRGAKTLESVKIPLPQPLIITGPDEVHFFDYENFVTAYDKIADTFTISGYNQPFKLQLQESSQYQGKITFGFVAADVTPTQPEDTTNQNP